MAAYRRVDDLTVTCRLTACTPDQLRAQRSVSSMGRLYLTFLPQTVPQTDKRAGATSSQPYCSEVLASTPDMITCFNNACEKSDDNVLFVVENECTHALMSTTSGVQICRGCRTTWRTLSYSEAFHCSSASRHCCTSTRRSVSRCGETARQS